MYHTFMQSNSSQFAELSIGDAINHRKISIFFNIRPSDFCSPTKASVAKSWGCIVNICSNMDLAAWCSILQTYIWYSYTTAGFKPMTFVNTSTMSWAIEQTFELCVWFSPLKISSQNLKFKLQGPIIPTSNSSKKFRHRIYFLCFLNLYI